MRIVDVGGCPVGALDRYGWVEHLAACVAEGTPHHHVSLNASKWAGLRRDPELRRAVRAATSVAADGMAIVLASRWLGDPLPERVPGCDLAEDLLARAAAEGWGVYLLGAAPEVVDAVRARLAAGGVGVVGARDGYFRPEDEPEVAAAVRDARPQLLLVALGTPKAETFVARWADTMRVPLAMGVGGTFDVLAGREPRAPRALGDRGLEWAWRLARAPRARFRRAVIDPARFALAMASGERIPAG